MQAEQQREDQANEEPSTSGEQGTGGDVVQRGQGQHGCQHYRRRCQLVAPCCGEVFWCRHCHNDAKTTNEEDVNKRHELDRTRVAEVICALCNTRQPVAEVCKECGVRFGVYSCLKCRFFDDDASKLQFHCDACGICRVGGRDKYFHCHRCGCCYVKNLKDNHKCVENSMRQNCPVCFEYLFDSVRATAVLPCGHTIHSFCLQEMERNGQLGCPICLKSYANLSAVWSRMDEEIAATPMPLFYQGYRAQIACNDCNRSSRVVFHAFGLKCPSEDCGSYNTRRLALERPVGAPEYDTPGPEAANGEHEHGMMVVDDGMPQPHIAELAGLMGDHELGEPANGALAANGALDTDDDDLVDAAYQEAHADSVGDAAMAAIAANVVQNTAALAQREDAAAAAGDASAGGAAVADNGHLARPRVAEAGSASGAHSTAHRASQQEHQT